MNPRRRNLGDDEIFRQGELGPPDPDGLEEGERVLEVFVVEDELVKEKGYYFLAAEVPILLLRGKVLGEQFLQVSGQVSHFGGRTPVDSVGADLPREVQLLLPRQLLQI